MEVRPDQAIRLIEARIARGFKSARAAAAFSSAAFFLASAAAATASSSARSRSAAAAASVDRKCVSQCQDQRQRRM